MGLKFISVTEHCNYLTFSKSRNVRIQISTPSEFIYYRFYQMTLFGLHPWEFTCAVMFEKSTWIERQGNVNCILNMQWLQALSRFRWIYGLLTYIIHTICVSHSMSRTHSQHSTSGQLSVFRLLYVVYSSEGKAATVAACDGYVFFFFHYNTQYWIVAPKRKERLSCWMQECLVCWYRANHPEKCKKTSVDTPKEN